VFSDVPGSLNESDRHSPELDIVAKGVDGDFFLMPQSSTTVFMAFCVPPLFMWVLACWIVLREPFALGNSNVG